MGIFSTLFNSIFKAKNYSQLSNSLGIVKREDLAIRLVGLRMKLVLMNSGTPESDAHKKAKNYVKETFSQNPSKALSTLEGSVAVIIHTYMNSLAQLHDSPDLKQDSDFINKHIITEIENHRKILYPGDDEFPLNISDYVYYRLRIELLGEFNCTPEERGFDSKTVKILSDSAQGFFLK
jgi:hypothetical protein